MLVMLAKAVMATLVSMAVAKWWSGAGVTASDNLNVVLNFASLVVLIAGVILAPKAFRAKAAEAMIGERDKTIVGLRQLLELREEECQAARDKQAELGTLLDETRASAAAWEARYAEQNRYTAQPALETIQQLLSHNNEEAERRHRELLLALRAFASKRFRVEEEGGGG